MMEILIAVYFTKIPKIFEHRNLELYTVASIARYILVMIAAKNSFTS